MSDARWVDVDADLTAMKLHFGNAVDLYALGGFDIEEQLDRYGRGYALMHAMQAGHTSAEAAMRRILDLLGEDRPTGEDWHKALIARLAMPPSGAFERPALFSHDVAADLYETLGFRRRAMHSYGDFNALKASPSIAAAASLRDSFPLAVARFRETVDPG